MAAARRLTRPAARLAAGRFLAEGPAAVREALTVEGGVCDLFVTADARDRFGDLVARATEAGVRTTLVTDEAAAGLSETVTPQGLVAVCDIPAADLDSVSAGRPRLVAVLAEIRDPGNAGTLVRTADAVGADAVVFAGTCVDPYNGKSVRASAGSIFHLPVVCDVGLAEAAGALRAAGLRVLAADGAADRDLDAIEAAGGLAGPTAWVFGNEARGLSPVAVAVADERLRVPMTGRAESLNVGAAAAICLYASARAHRAALAGAAS